MITLTASPEAIMERVGARLSERPNIAVGGDPLARVRELLDERVEAYAECHATIATDAADADDIVSEIVAVSERAPIAVPLGLRTYVIDVCHNVPSVLTDAIALLAPSSLVIVTDANVQRRRHPEAALGHSANPANRRELACG